VAMPVLKGPGRTAPPPAAAHTQRANPAGMTGTAQNQVLCVRPAARKARRPPRPSRRSGARASVPSSRAVVCAAHCLTRHIRRSGAGPCRPAWFAATRRPGRSAAPCLACRAPTAPSRAPPTARNCQHRDPNLVMKSGTSPAELHRNLDAARQGATGRWGAYTAASSPLASTRHFAAATTLLAVVT
jgi:hypothetical protein